MTSQITWLPLTLERITSPASLSAASMLSATIKLFCISSSSSSLHVGRGAPTAATSNCVRKWCNLTCSHYRHVFLERSCFGKKAHLPSRVNSEFTEEDGRKKRKAKRLYLTNVTGLLLTCFFVIFT